MSNPSNVHEWVKAAKAGEELAWSRLYRQYYPGAYAIALRICGNTPTAEDAVQDAFMVAYLKLAQLNDDNTFGGWIKKIVMHTCYRAIQRNRSHKQLDSLTLELEPDYCPATSIAVLYRDQGKVSRMYLHPSAK